MASNPQHRAIASGLVLIAVGLLLYYLDSIEGVWQYGGIVVGGILMATYFYTRQFGLLIPAVLLMTLGLGYLGEERRLLDLERGNAIPLGAGFVAMFAIHWAYARKLIWWPLIPGLVLIAVGFDQLGKWIAALGEHWPLVLVAVGVVIIASALIRRGDGGSAKA